MKSSSFKLADTELEGEHVFRRQPTCRRTTPSTRSWSRRQGVGVFNVVDPRIVGGFERGGNIAEGKGTISSHHTSKCHLFTAGNQRKLSTLRWKVSISFKLANVELDLE